MKKLCIVIYSLCLAACASTQPQSPAVIISTQPVPPGCQYVGKLSGGNAVQANQASPRDQLNNATYQDLKQQAAQLGANYVQVITSKANSAAAFATGSTTTEATGRNVTNTAQAYQCPPQALANVAMP